MAMTETGGESAPTLTGRSRGATLLEVLISLAIVAVLMVLIARIVTFYSLIVQSQERKSEALYNIRMALDTVSTELEEALLIYSPEKSGDQAAELRMCRLNPEKTGDTFKKRFGLEITYYLEGGDLFRKTTYPGIYGIDASTMLVSHNICGFSVKREHDHYFIITMAMQEKQRVLTLTRKTCVKTGY